MKLNKILKRASREGWAVPEFNFCTIEQFWGIVNSSLRLHAPVILGTTRGAIDFLKIEAAEGLINVVQKMGAPVFLNFDHGHDPELIFRAVKQGYDEVHIDASSLSLTENISLTKKIVNFAHRKRVLVEGEVGRIRGNSDLKEAPQLRKEEFANPEDVRTFCQKTRVDLVGVAIGNMHGSYQGAPHIRIDLLKKIREKTDAFLVLHGTSGIPENVIKEVVRTGVQKVNINTNIRKVWRSSLESSLRDSESIKAYKILSPVVENISKIVEKYIMLLDADGKIE